MRTDSARFSDRLMSVEPLSPALRVQLEQELQTMFMREVSPPRRSIYGVVALVALVSAGVCGSLAITEADLPTPARLGLGTGVLFGLAWATVAARIALRGKLDLQSDGRRIASMVWVFTTLMMVFFLMVGMMIEDRLLGLMMIGNGLAFLIEAAVYWLTHRIEQAELNTRERLLQLELRMAEWAESRSPGV